MLIVHEILFHFTALIHHLYIIKYSHNDIDFNKTTNQHVLDMKNFQNRYFTGWNLAMQTIYFTLAVCYDILQFTSMMPRLQLKLLSWKGYIFTTWVFPWTFFVFVMFWSVYFINREWVLPEASDVVIPKWFNHSIHTSIIIFLIIETFIASHPSPSFKTALMGLSFGAVIYDVLFLFTYYESGRWLYGLFYIFNWYERILFLIFNYISAVVVMRMGISVQRILSYMKKPLTVKTN